MTEPYEFEWSRAKCRARQAVRKLVEEMDMPEELCCICDLPTGRAGRGDDSIYRQVAPDYSKPSNPSYVDIVIAPYCARGECGPLCAACNSAYDDKFLPE